MQELITKDTERLTLHWLRKQHLESGLAGECIARIAPDLYASAIELPGFCPARRYLSIGITKVDDAEIGFVELFRLSLSSPAKYQNSDLEPRTNEFFI